MLFFLRIGMIATAAFAFSCGLVPGTAASCDFTDWRTFKGTKLKITSDGSADLYVTDHARVDADGAPDAYHPDDVGSCGATGVGRDCPANAGYPNTTWWRSVLVPDPKRPFAPLRSG